MAYTATLTIVNSTLAGNDTGLYVDNNPFTITAFHNNIFWGNTANDVFVKDNKEAVITSNNLIGKDPLFADAANGDYSLLENSPAINAGNNLYLNEITTDLLGNLRISNGTVDLGAYEFQNTSSAISPVSATALKIYTQYHNIMIENTTAAVQVYNIGGQIVAQGAGAGSYAVPSAGVYIVRAGSEVRKVIVP